MRNRMFDAVVIATADPTPAARTFATLVEGVVAGMVRRVTLLSAADGEGLSALADASGSRAALAVPVAAFGDALRGHLDTGHVIALEAGALLPADWPNRLKEELQRRGEPPPDAGLAFRPAALAARLRLHAALAARRRIPLRHGVLAPKAALLARGFDGVSAPAGGRWIIGRITVERTKGW
jgi:hypothetical protein